MPTDPTRPAPRRGWLETATIAAFLLGLLVFFLNYVLGGLDGVAYAWYEVQQAILDFLAWRINVYVLALVPGVAVAAFLLRHCLPIIEIPLLGTGSLEARVLRKWYWPGSFRIQDAEASWREGKHRAFVNKALITRNGAFLGHLVVTPVERNVSEADGEVTYDAANVPAYVSRTLHRRLQREAQERIVQDHRALREMVKP